MNTPIPDAPVTMKEIQQVTGLSRPSVLKALAAGQLPGSKIGNKWVTTRRSFELFKEHGRWPIDPRPVLSPPVSINPIVPIKRASA